MYEKPQYITRNGYRRTSEKPQNKNIRETLLSRKKTHSAEDIISTKDLTKNSCKVISKKAAKLIALSIKGMLNQ